MGLVSFDLSIPKKSSLIEKLRKKNAFTLGVIFTVITIIGAIEKIIKNSIIKMRKVDNLA